MTAAGLTKSIKARAALVDPSRYGRSDRSAMGMWFWEIDRVLLLLLAVLIGIGLLAVAAASPAAAPRSSGGSVKRARARWNRWGWPPSRGANSSSAPDRPRGALILPTPRRPSSRG